MRTNPNQKIITIKKAKCDKNNLYMLTNLNALQLAAQNLKAGAFKLWIYFSQNQNDYQFALSNKDANESFGIKKDQYDSAIKELETKGYLFKDHGNNWIFSEVAKNHNENLEVVKNHNETIEEKFVVGKNHNVKVVKNHNELQEKTTTESGKKPQEILQDNTINNTNNSTLTDDFFANKKEKGSFTDPIPITANELNTYGISPANLTSTTNSLLIYKNKYLKPVRESFTF